MVRRRQKRKCKRLRVASAKGEEPPDPVTLTVLAVTGTVIGAAGTVFGAVSANNQAKAQASAARDQAYQQAAYNQSNALAAQRDATFAADQAKYNETLARQQADRVRGSQRAAIGASGMDFSGSALDLLESSAIQSEMDALQIRSTGQYKSDSFGFEAAGQRSQASSYSKRAGSITSNNSALTTGLISAGTQLTSGLATSGYNYGVMRGAY